MVFADVIGSRKTCLGHKEINTGFKSDPPLYDYVPHCVSPSLLFVKLHTTKNEFAYS